MRDELVDRTAFSPGPAEAMLLKMLISLLADMLIWAPLVRTKTLPTAVLLRMSIR